MLTGSLFNTFCQSVMSFAKDELTIELTIVDCSLGPKKLFHVISLNSLIIYSCTLFLAGAFQVHFLMLYNLGRTLEIYCQLFRLTHVSIKLYIKNCHFNLEKLNR